MPRVKLFKEEEVLNKAVDLFWKQGFSATSVQDLVSNLGINRASLYATFGDKEQLFIRAFKHYRETNLIGLKQFLDSYSNVKEGFLMLFKTAIEDAVKDTDCKGCFVVNVTTELVPGDVKILNILEENKIVIETIFYEYLLKGQEAGQFKTTHDLKALASLFLINFNGLKVVSKVKPNKKELGNTITIMLSLLQ